MLDKTHKVMRECGEVFYELEQEHGTKYVFDHILKIILSSSVLDSDSQKKLLELQGKISILKREFRNSQTDEKRKKILNWEIAELKSKRNNLLDTYKKMDELIKGFSMLAGYFGKKIQDTLEAEIPLEFPSKL